jgi:acetyl-CoA C-acetyltransferase
MGAHVIKAAVERAGIDPAEVEDVLMGCANPEGATGMQHRAPGRAARRAAGRPCRASPINRFCSSRPADDRDGRAARASPTRATSTWPAAWSRSPACRASTNQPHVRTEAWLLEHKPVGLLTPCCRPPRPWPSATASRASAGRVRRAQPAAACAARAAGRFDAEIVPITVTHGQRRQGHRRQALRSEVHAVSDDEGLRAGTTVEGVANIKPAMPGGAITAGNASQFSDGAGACVVDEREPTPSSAG